MNKKYLFITQSDLYSGNSNGRTLRDVFGYLNNDEIYSFCTSRYNEDLSPDHTFCIDESRLFKRKNIHRQASIKSNNKFISSKNIRKNPLTCILRNCLWSVSFIFWKRKYKKWLKEVNPDIIVFNIGDFIFMQRIARFTSRYLNKKIIIYNTEDYYFKTWNYLHDERGHKKLYKVFRRKLVNSYNKTFKYCKIVIHNTKELCERFAKAFPNTKQICVYHPSNIKGNIDKQFILNNKMYYCGLLDKGRDKLLIDIANIIYKIKSDFIIEVNGSAKESTIEELKKCKNIKYNGVIKYSEVVKKIIENEILLGLNSLDPYNKLDKRHAFSTKASDYIASFNIIFHVSLENDEFNTIKKFKLGYASSSLEEVENNFKKLLNDRSNPFKHNMINFYNSYLKPSIVWNTVKKEVE